MDCIDPSIVGVYCCFMCMFVLSLPEIPLTITVPLRDTVTMVAEEASMSCEVSKPNQKVQWLKNGKPIKPDKNTKVEVDGKVHKLTIPKSDLGDQAEYTVKLGDEVTTGKLSVSGV